MAKLNAEPPVAVSPSLLENISITVLTQFSLGMEEWTDFFLESIKPTVSLSRLE